MIAYVEDKSKWEAWQRDYRLGTILILPPPAIALQIDALRARYDPRSFAICPAHISVSDPLSREMTLELREEICHILSAVSPFEVAFDTPQASTQYAGVSYPIRPQETINALQHALHSSSAFSDRLDKRRNIPAHMTIAEFLSIEDSLNLCETIKDVAPSGAFTCDRVDFVVPDESFRFQKMATFLLDGAKKSKDSTQPASQDSTRPLC